MGGTGEIHFLFNICPIYILYIYIYIYRTSAYFLIEVHDYLSICEQEIREHGEMDQTIMHCIFLGAAGVGKSSLMKRLLGLELDPIRTSTQIAENSVRVKVKNVERAVAQVSGLHWQIIEDPSTQARELMDRMFTKQGEKSKEHNLRVGETSTQAAEQREVRKALKQDSELNEKMSIEKERELKEENEFKRDNSEGPGQIKQLQQQKLLKEENHTPVDASSKQVSEQLEQDSRIPHSSEYTLESPEYTLESPEHTASKSQPLQFSKMDFFRDVLNEEGLSGLKQHIDNPWTLYLTDSGGQTEFQELLPGLVVGPCIFIVVFPLDKDLKKEYIVEYVRSDEQKRVTYPSSFNLEEDLMRSLASIASTKYKDKDGNEVKARVLLVATFMDQVSQEDCQTKLDYIKCLVKETDVYHQGMVENFSDTQMVFTISNVSEEAENDAQKIRKGIQKIAEDFVVPTPYPWLIFGILVQHVYGNDKSVISKEECFELAQECGIDETKFEAALQFLHKQTGILHYYQEPSELRQIVIRNPQHLFDRVSCLVEKTFIFEKTSVEKCIDEFKRGIFKRKDYYRLTKDSRSSKLTSDMLLKLLEHLKIVMPLSGSEKYFMPCAIAHVDKAQPATIDQSCTTIPPLLITFKSGYCPKGLFGALVACIANEEVANCTLNLDEAKIYRDQICFTIGRYNLQLKVNPTYICIEIIPDNPDIALSILSTLCNSVRKLIFNNIKIACGRLHYSDDANRRLSFECNQCGELEKFHAAVLREDQDNCFYCFRAEKVVDIKKECYIWLPQVSRKVHGVKTKRV